MQKEYNPQEIELKVQKIWDEQSTFKVVEDADKEKFWKSVV